MSEEKVLTKEIAEQFLKDAKSVDLSLFTTIEDAAAKILSNAGWRICLPREEVCQENNMSEEKVLTKEIAEQFLADEESVDLSVYTTINEDAAESLSKYKGTSLNLFGITQISTITAASLAKYSGEVWLGGITELVDEQVIESLTKIKGNPVEDANLRIVNFTALQKLKFNISTFYHEDAQIIFQNPERKIKLNSPLDGTAMELLLPYRDKVDYYFPEELEILTLQKAQRLAENPRKTPWGLEIRDHHHKLITDEAALYLASQDVASLDLSGLVLLSEESADFLATFKGKNSSSSSHLLSLNGLMEINSAIAKKLAKFEGHLFLNRLHNLDHETAKEISNFSASELHLSGMGPNFIDLGEIQENHAYIYGDYLGIDQLYGEEVDKEVVDAVYKFKGKLHAGF